MSERPLHNGYPLPRVSMEAGESLLADALEQGSESVTMQASERLMVNNPELYRSVGQFAIGWLGENADPESVDLAYKIMVITHELLRRQGEADNLQHTVTPPES